ncbi:hypothetical protein ACFL2Q_10385 [Thermodesulfobacteriota bacterium]
MNLKAKIILVALIAAVISMSAPAQAQKAMYLGLCQELVNTARSYESRAEYHSRVAQGLKSQIEAWAKLPKNPGTIQGMDNLFSQYDEHRTLEQKFRELYRKATQESDKCMKSVQ